MKFLQKTVPIIFGITFTIVLVLLFCFSGTNYYLKRNFLVHNIYILFLFIVPTFFIYYFFIKDKEISSKKYYIWLIIISLLTFILQLTIAHNIYFYSDWDVKVIRDLVDEFILNGNLKNNYYLSIYPNNILLTGILVGFRLIPILGKHYFTYIGVSCLLVNLAGIFTSLTIKNVSNKKAALRAFIILIPLIMLSPWIVIPYSDTFSILFPILILFIYTLKEKNYIIIY